MKLIGSLSAETAVEYDMPQAWPHYYKVTFVTGKTWVCSLEESITHHLLQTVESGVVLGISDTKLQLPETTLHKQWGHMYRWLQA